MKYSFLLTISRAKRIRKFRVRINIYIVKIYRACTNKLSRSSSSPWVKSKQSNVTCSDLIRSHQTYWWGDRSERKLSNLVPFLIGWTHIQELWEQFACSATEDFRVHISPKITKKNNKERYLWHRDRLDNPSILSNQLYRRVRSESSQIHRYLWLKKISNSKYWNNIYGRISHREHIFDIWRRFSKDKQQKKK